MAELSRSARAGVALVGDVWRERGRIAWPLVWRQAYVVGNGSALFVGTSMGCVGAILVVQAGIQTQALVGDMSLVGPAFLQLLTREFGPLLVAMLLAARYGAGVAAELGAMAISEQVDALRLSGTNPARFLVLPRLLGSLVAAVPITVWGCACAFAAGGVAAIVRFDVRASTYMGTQLTSGDELVVGLVKSLVFAGLVPMVAAHAGLRARLGAPGVGRATTRAVIFSSVGLLASDLAVDLALSGCLRLAAAVVHR